MSDHITYQPLFWTPTREIAEEQVSGLSCYIPTFQYSSLWVSLTIVWRTSPGLLVLVDLDQYACEASDDRMPLAGHMTTPCRPYTCISQKYVNVKPLHTSHSAFFILRTPHFPRTALRVFHTPHSSFSTLRTPRFPHFALRVFRALFRVDTVTTRRTNVQPHCTRFEPLTTAIPVQRSTN